MKDTNFKGYIYSIISAVAFGTIPLFSLPLMKIGMLPQDILIYRFGMGCCLMLAILLFRKVNMRIGRKDVLEYTALAALYGVSAICLYEGYNYMPSGVATTLLYSYPVFTEILLVTFFREHISIPAVIAIILAVVGVSFLGGMWQSDGIKSMKGMFFELTSGFLYALYMVLFPRLRVHRMPSLKTNFYIFLMAMILIAVFTSIRNGGLQPIPSYDAVGYLFVLALVPTTISNLSLVKALSMTNPANVAILGAFEPLTAMSIGICLLGEPLTASIVIGFTLIIVGIITLISAGRKKKTQQTSVKEA